MMYQFFMLLYVCAFITSPLTAITPNENQEEKNLRICELLPNLACPLAVNPSIPTDFIALSPSGNMDPYDWIYWGPKSVLEAYFKNPNSLNTPILRVKLSANVTQYGSNSFTDKKFLKELKKQTPKRFASLETKWGDYPVCAIKTQVEDQLIFMAWVGLNDSNAGWTLMFNLVYSENKNYPDRQDIQLWDSLIKETTLLKDGDYFKAYGQDMQEGYTIVNINGTKLKMIAEKRESDGLMQVVVIPKSSDIEFQYIDMTEGLMGAKWKEREPIVKVRSKIEINKNNYRLITNDVTSIFFKTVAAFSFKKEDENKDLIFQQNCEK